MVGTRSNPNGSEVVQSSDDSNSVTRNEFDKLGNQVGRLGGEMDKLAQRFDAFFNMWSNSQKNSQEHPQGPRPDQDTNSSNTRKSKSKVTEDEDSAIDGITRLSKIEFPIFDGSNAEEWLFRAEQFFELDGTKENREKRREQV